MSVEHQSASRRVLEIATPRYEQKWVEYVFSLRTIRAMCDAIADCSYSTFLKRFSPQWLDRQARSTFRFKPEYCLASLKIEDAEVSQLIAAAQAARTAADAFWNSVDKKPVPFE